MLHSENLVGTSANSKCSTGVALQSPVVIQSLGPQGEHLEMRGGDILGLRGDWKLLLLAVGMQNILHCASSPAQ